MNIEIPHYVQEKPNTCALACLRMVLAGHGVAVREEELEAQAAMEPRGTPIGELERLARRYGLVADIQTSTMEDLQRILAEGKLPIAFIDRKNFDLTPTERARHRLRDAILHNVIPVKITKKSVTLHDPRFPEVTRRTLHLFRRAFEGLGGICVVYAKPEEPEEGEQG